MNTLLLVLLILAIRLSHFESRPYFNRVTHVFCLTYLGSAENRVLVELVMHFASKPTSTYTNKSGFLDRPQGLFPLFYSLNYHIGKPVTDLAKTLDFFLFNCFTGRELISGSSVKLKPDTCL